MTIVFRLLFTIFALCLYLTILTTLSASSAGAIDPAGAANSSRLWLVSTESDPDAFIDHNVNVINGDYCESATDLIIPGPDALILQRFYSTKNAVTGTPGGGWRILPQRFLVIGKDPSSKSRTIGKDQFEWSCAFAGERSGGILPYEGWRNINGSTQDPLKIDVLKSALGMVNTYASNINGQTNHQNNSLHCKGSTCELILGDGTKRIYQEVPQLPCVLLGEELTPSMAHQVTHPEYFLLVQEILPSGNQIFYSYDAEGHLTSLEMQNSQTKVLSWIRLRYDFQTTTCQVHIETSDCRQLTYRFARHDHAYQLVNVTGSHCRPVAYAYQTRTYGGALTKRMLPAGRFLEIEYEQDRVKCVKGPHPESSQPVIIHSFAYGKDYTDVWDAMGTKTRHLYDKRSQLTAIERYNEHSHLYRVEQKFWGKTNADAGRLLAKTIRDGTGRIFSYRSLQYDPSGNVVEERLYGNLTGKQEVSLQVSDDGKLLNPDEEECSIKKFDYSTDGWNLITRIGDCKGNQTLYTYKVGTNLLIKKYIFDKNVIKKRTFQFYNEDGTRIKVIEDDGSGELESQLWHVTERHIQVIKPKETLPGIGYPEIIEERALDLKSKKEILLRKHVNTYDPQSNLLACSTYDANSQYAFTEKHTYNLLGQITSQTDPSGRETVYTYDEIGNQTSLSVPQDHTGTITTYDLRNQPIEVTTVNTQGDDSKNDSFTTKSTYDPLGRKIASIDRFGNSTLYEYDAFHRLTKVIHPEVLDENQHIIRPIFSYTYDLFGNVLTMQDPRGFVTTKSYNLRGNPTKISYPDGSYELFKYDTEGSLHRSLTREQIITVYEYDYLGRSVYEESYTTSETGSSSFLISRSHKYNGFRCTYEKEDNLVKRYDYDPAGRLISIVQHASEKYENDPQSRRTEILYNPLGRPHQKRVWFDIGPQDYSLECFEYDLVGNITEKRIETIGTTLLRKGFAYDKQGHCIEEYSLENGTKTSLIKTCYNSLGEPISYVDGLGAKTQVLFNNSYQNEIGQTVLKKTLVNPLGVQTEIEFDSLSRIHSIIKKGSLGLLLSSQTILYDALGNKACEIHDQIVDGKVIGSQTFRWIYGPMGRLEEEVEAAGSSLEKSTQYSHNSLGQIVSKTITGISTPITYTYNKDGKLHKIEAQDSKKDIQVSNSYSYDRKGNITSAHALHGKSIQKTYNAFNQVTEETVKDGEGQYTLKYVYDRKGRLKEIVLPDLSKISYTYDAVLGRAVKRVSNQEKLLYTHTYDQYDEQGKLLQETHIGNVGSSEYAYDLNGKKISAKNTFFNERYTRDVLGRLVDVKDLNQEEYKEYTYNDLSQLISEKQSTQTTKATTQIHAYDSLDNCIQTGNETLLYNARNQLVSSRAEFSYDPQGNLLKKTLDGEETRFESNLLSQLMCIEKADRTKLTFSYDPFGRLLVEKHLDVKGKNKKHLSTTRYLYLGYQEIGTLSDNEYIETLKIPGLRGDAMTETSIAFEIKGNTYVPLHDIAGNVTCLIDPQNLQIIESYQYTAFGESTANSHGESVGNPWRFAEKRTDQHSGLILFGLRFYDPHTGRWMSPDPAGLIDGPNLYSYLHNNPLNYLDRFGLATETNSQNKFDEYFYGEVEAHCYCEKHRTCKRGGDIGKTTSSNLPTVSHDYFFEKYHKDIRVDGSVIKDFYDISTWYDLSDEGLPNLPNDLGIGYINGIWNDLKGSKESARYVSRLAGGYNIHVVYNGTHGVSTDIMECGFGLKHIATEPVRQLHNMWNSFFEKKSANAKFLMICHSQGVIHVMNALLDYPEKLRKRIFVVAIAPGGYIYRETCARVIHYRNAKWWRDFVPRLDREGVAREQDTTVELISHPDASFFDHEFMSPTFTERLQRHINNFIKSNTP